jgi:hypothetical protein
VLSVIWHLLTDPDATFRDLGVGFYDTQVHPQRRARHHVRQLEALGYQVTAIKLAAA